MSSTTTDTTVPRENRELMRRYFQTLYDPVDGFDGAAVVYVANGKGKPQDVRFIRPGDIDRLVDETADLAQQGQHLLPCRPHRARRG